jgi:hypothetical protein
MRKQKIIFVMLKAVGQPNRLDFSISNAIDMMIFAASA